MHRTTLVGDGLRATAGNHDAGCADQEPHASRGRAPVGGIAVAPKNTSASERGPIVTHGPDYSCRPAAIEAVSGCTRPALTPTLSRKREREVKRPTIS